MHQTRGLHLHCIRHIRSVKFATLFQTFNNLPLDFDHMWWLLVVLSGTDCCSWTMRDNILVGGRKSVNCTKKGPTRQHSSILKRNELSLKAALLLVIKVWTVVYWKWMLYIDQDDEIYANSSSMLNLLSTTQPCTVHANHSSCSLIPKWNSRHLHKTINWGHISGGICRSIKARPMFAAQRVCRIAVVSERDSLGKTGHSAHRRRVSSYEHSLALAG